MARQIQSSNQFIRQVETLKSVILIINGILTGFLIVCHLREKMIRCKNLDMKKYNNKSYDLQSGGGDNIKEKIYKNLPT